MRRALPLLLVLFVGCDRESEEPQDIEPEPAADIPRAETERREPPRAARAAAHAETRSEPAPQEGPMPTKPEVVVPAGAPPRTLQIEDVTVGDGAEATAGRRVSVQYVGVAWSTKRQFDASWDRGRPFGFALGAGRVIRGWDEGVKGMKVGGRRRLTIPPDMGYGERGAGDDIGPNETLVFVVDLLSVE